MTIDQNSMVAAEAGRRIEHLRLDMVWGTLRKMAEEWLKAKCPPVRLNGEFLEYNDYTQFRTNTRFTLQVTFEAYRTPEPPDFTTIMDVTGMTAGGTRPAPSSIPQQEAAMRAIGNRLMEPWEEPTSPVKPTRPKTLKAQKKKVVRDIPVVSVADKGTTQAALDKLTFKNVCTATKDIQKKMAMEMENYLEANRQVSSFGAALQRVIGHSWTGFPSDSADYFKSLPPLYREKMIQHVRGMPSHSGQAVLAKLPAIHRLFDDLVRRDNERPMGGITTNPFQ